MDIIMKQLIQSLQLLSTDYEEQVRVLPESLCVPDEIALNFDQYYLMKDQLVEKGLVSLEQEKHLDEINELLETMSTADDKTFLWSLEGRQKDPRWAELRQKARSALGAFGRKQEKPNLSGVTYIEGTKQK